MDKRDTPAKTVVIPRLDITQALQTLRVCVCMPDTECNIESSTTAFLRHGRTSASTRQGGRSDNGSQTDV
eukprot:4185717-Amphidinium_carterae.1